MHRYQVYLSCPVWHFSALKGFFLEPLEPPPNSAFISRPNPSIQIAIFLYYWLYPQVN
uniref:Uncharacterized protein n=1 Tax=Anguilla anguilla TaxID=7936 RepID=A0A0E9WQY9_ANGAN